MCECTAPHSQPGNLLSEPRATLNEMPCCEICNIQRRKTQGGAICRVRSTIMRKRWSCLQCVWWMRPRVQLESGSTDGTLQNVALGQLTHGSSEGQVRHDASGQHKSGMYVDPPRGAVCAMRLQRL